MNFAEGSRADVTGACWCDKSRVQLHLDHPRCHSTAWICVYGHIGVVVIIFQFSSKSDQGFWDHGDRHCLLSIFISPC